MRSKTFSNAKPVSAISLHTWLLLSSCFSIGMAIIRVIVTGELTYLFLVWNLFLGFIPFAIAQWLGNSPRILSNRWLFYPLLFAWLVFIPNAFYIVTDLFHLEKFDEVPKWFDLLLLYSFAWNGLVLGLLSVRRIEMIVSVVTGKTVSVILILLVMWLNAFGIYIGRYLRYNTWDILVQPFELLREMFYIIVFPLDYKMEWSMMLVYGMFMTLVYFTSKKLWEPALPDGRKRIG